MKQTLLILILLVSFNVHCQTSSSGEDSLVGTSKFEKGEKPDSLKLFVFVGEKIFFKARKRFPPWSFSRKYVAKYRVIECIYGNCDKETIRFKAYSHLDLNGYPEYALLFVNKDKHSYYLEYRQMIPLEKTLDGQWANCGHWNRGNDKSGNEIEPVPLEFPDTTWHDLSNLDEEMRPKYYPEPYYEIIGDSARCLMGFYAGDLFTIRKNGVLKARGIF